MSSEHSHSNKVSTYVLVHGAYHGGWCWGRVASRLRAQGHVVHTPTLTGLADRSHLLSPAITLSTHVLDIVNLFRWEELQNVILCGHSYGGMVITGATAEIHSALHSVVYLDAIVPQNGKSLADLLPSELTAFIKAKQDWLVRPPNASSMTNNRADEDWVQRQMTAHPLASFKEPATGADAVARLKRRFYILATGNAISASIFERYARALECEPGWRVERIPGGHDLMIDSPDEVTRLLLDAASPALTGAHHSR